MSRRLAIASGLLALAAGCLSVFGTSTPGGETLILLIATMLWVVAGISWLVAVWSLREDDAPAKRSRWLTAAPAILLLTLVARFELSRAALESVETTNPTYDDTSDAGLYKVCCFERTDFGYRIGVSEGFNVIWGFAYSPDGRPPGPDISAEPLGPSLQEGEIGYRHLKGPWYVFEFAYT
jgi:hypothetical protein